ncbi:hypothetical protein HME9304_02381 [Flagellimonas maritima]|uniref:Carboxypeptidase-like regulatory domain-containing protein n=1 Tax=Flagellimonas maritima TaxID=1383885 RepID=A0A2Z4LVM0_9FLAO|nr:carboxypeptidase-like regulatory domain-containing protein [Allomuricauda aurantiaca]AWX45367.1 hypothetical protein HME9304_02381 [Allomuricauda aurantiaca]
MRSKLFFFLSVAVIFASNAQKSNQKEIKGKVYSKDKDVVGVVVQNITSNSAVITGIDGNFSILAKLSDTLIFSAVQFKRKLLPVTEELLNTKSVTVILEEFVNELKEVVVKPFNLSGDLGQDLGGLELEKNVSAEALGLPNAHRKIPTQSERKLQQSTFGKFNPSMILAPPLDPIINAITGRTKMLKNRVKVDKAYARTQRVQDVYIDSLFVTTFKIPAEKINDFMYFCEVDEKFQQTVDSKDRLKILDYLISRSRVYREVNNLD